MRDPFESGPVLRLGDAPAKKLIAESRAARPETGIVPNAEIVAIEAPKTETATSRPPSLDPAFGDAFGAALSKPRTRGDLVDWIEKHGVYDLAKMPAYPSFAQVDAEVLSEEEFARRYPESLPIVFDEVATVPDSAWRNAALRGATRDDVVITGIVRKKDGPK